MVSAPSRMAKGCTAWLMSTICASGAMSKMTPFMAPTKWSLSPKSVVRVTIGMRAILYLYLVMTMHEVSGVARWYVKTEDGGERFIDPSYGLDAARSLAFDR